MRPRDGQPIDVPSSTTSSAPRPLRPPRELLVAWTLLLLDAGKTYGYTLHHDLLGRGIDLQASSMYRWLAKFERDGWVVSSWSDPVDGPRRHVYELTPEGRSALREMVGVIAAMREMYAMFVAAHAHAVARRGDGPLDTEATPVTQPGATPPAEDEDRTRQAPAAQRPLRTQKELLVGWVLLQLDAGATYGYELRREFAARGLSPDPGAVYRMLRRLESDKWVQSRWMRPAAGPPRRFYRLTSRGRRNLDEIAGLIATTRDAHDAFLDAAGHSDDPHEDRVLPSSPGPPPAA